MSKVDPNVMFDEFTNEPSTSLRESTRVASHAERIPVGRLPAVHAAATARTREGSIALDLTWIAHAGHMYRITGATRPDALPRTAPLFRATVESFRPLTERELAAVRETRSGSSRYAPARRWGTCSAAYRARGTRRRPRW